ncbi:orotidine-5'-phosphate decarboxylase [Jatrophihabitans endophyticus]|uniref:orotidine-5'-phosphate decarboxylase n=1 Tax=Jatrophihabitans endophyticus TaxID=1206085 RepID=UPI001A0E8F8F|nr:orotidine-5'-phosphate decarboxylase [Jatrophihabitans endophyticus]
MTFGARLDAALDARGSLCVGIDPHPSLLADWGLSVDADGLARFAATCVAAFGDLAAVVKPQSAFFELHGSSGIAVLEGTLATLREAGAIAVLDAKRGDIGSTVAAYAAAYLDPSSPLACDAITVNPYLGVGALDPVFELCERHDAGAFVLARTSNKEGAQVQDARVADGRTVAQVIVDDVAARNAGAEPLGSLGVVVGATVDPEDCSVGELNGPVLAPGVGAQGGTAADVRRVFGASARAVLPSASREVLRHGPDIGALRDAVSRLVEDFAFLRG